MALIKQEYKPKKFESGLEVNFYQEDWYPFENLPNAIEKFTELSGVKVNLSWDKLVSTNVTDKMWEEMENSFIEDEPPYDLVCADTLILKQYVNKGKVQELDNFIEDDSFLNDFEPSALEACTMNNALYGIPSCHVCNCLMYRKDLFDKYKIKVPETMEELSSSASAIQQAVREDGMEDFYGITARGAKGAGYIGWIFTSTWAPSWGVNFYDNNDNPAIIVPEHVEALDNFIKLFGNYAPPDQAELEWLDSLSYYLKGKTAMVIEVATEFSNIFRKGGDIAEKSLCTMVPAGPIERQPGLYAPAYAIPKKSKVKEAAWELTRYLCSPSQQLEDAMNAEVIETASKSTINYHRIKERYRKDLLDVVKANRKIARDSRPYSSYGLEPTSILGDEYNLVLRAKKNIEEALKDAEKMINSLGQRW